MEAWLFSSNSKMKLYPVSSGFGLHKQQRIGSAGMCRQSLIFGFPVLTGALAEKECSLVCLLYVVELILKKSVDKACCELWPGIPGVLKWFSLYWNTCRPEYAA